MQTSTNFTQSIEKVEQISKLNAKLNDISSDLQSSLSYFFYYFHVFNIACYLMMLYFLQSMVQLLFIKRMGRKGEFPSVQ